MFLLVKCTLYLKVFLFEVILMETSSLKVFLRELPIRYFFAKHYFQIFENAF